MMIRWIFAFSLIVLAGCAAVPDPLEGDYSQAFQPSQATGNSIGARVRWGGSVVETVPESDRTCIEILAHELDTTTRPVRTDEDLGRFLACRDAFLDPEIFTRGREVTVTGRLTGFQSGTVGEFEYEYPLIETDAVYLWPERTDFDRYDYHGWYHPYYPYAWWPYYRRSAFFWPYW
jgi:outer membrane lipoprotein